MSTIDKVYRYIEGSNRIISSCELVEKILNIKGANEEVSNRLVMTIVGNDNRFIRAEEGWSVLKHEKCAMAINQLEFSVISILSADVSMGRSVIVEIDVRKIKKWEVISRFNILVNPGETLLNEFTECTGITNDILSRKPPIKEILPYLLRFLDDSVLVFYNEKEFKVLYKVARKLDEEIENPYILIKTISRKLQPDLPFGSLEHVASVLKIPFEYKRRAERDSVIVTELFLKLCEKLNKRGILTFDDLMVFQNNDLEKVDYGFYAFDKDFLFTLPRKPGVYIMKNKDGTVIYVGKAKNLRNRVSSYFYNKAVRDEKVKTILNEVYDIDYETVDSELEALLLEFKLIKKYQPHLNQKIEIHERFVPYVEKRRVILFLRSDSEDVVKLFIVAPEYPIQVFDVLRDAVNLSSIEDIIETTYFSMDDSKKEPSEIANAEKEILLSWFEGRQDTINYIDMNFVKDTKDAIRLLKNYIKDPDLHKKKLYYV